MDELVRLYAATLGHRYFQETSQIPISPGFVPTLAHACDCGWKANILNPTDKSERRDQWFAHILFYESQKANEPPKTR